MTLYLIEPTSRIAHPVARLDIGRGYIDVYLLHSDRLDVPQSVLDRIPDQWADYKRGNDFRALHAALSADLDDWAVKSNFNVYDRTKGS